MSPPAAAAGTSAAAAAAGLAVPLRLASPLPPAAVRGARRRLALSLGAREARGHEAAPPSIFGLARAAVLTRGARRRPRRPAVVSASTVVRRGKGHDGRGHTRAEVGADAGAPTGPIASVAAERFGIGRSAVFLADGLGCARRGGPLHEVAGGRRGPRVRGRGRLVSHERGGRAADRRRRWRRRRGRWHVR